VEGKAAFFTNKKTNTERTTGKYQNGGMCRSWSDIYFVPITEDMAFKFINKVIGFVKIINLFNRHKGSIRKYVGYCQQQKLVPKNLSSIQTLVHRS